MNDAGAATDRAPKTSYPAPVADRGIRIYYRFTKDERHRDAVTAAVARDGTFYLHKREGRQRVDRYVCLRPRVKEALLAWVKQLVRILPEYLQGRPTRGTHGQRLELFSPAGRRRSESASEAHRRGYFAYEGRWAEQPRPSYPLSRLLGRLHRLLERHEKHAAPLPSDEGPLC